MLLSKPILIHECKWVIGLGLLMLLFILVYSSNIANPVNGEYGAIPKSYLADCALDQIPQTRAPVKAWLLCLSQNEFGNVNVISFMFSLGMIPLVFLLGRRITNDPRKAIVSSGLLLLSPILGYLGTTAALSADWAFFLLLSLYSSYKRPELAGVFFFISVASKAFPMLLLPAIMYLIYRMPHQGRKKAIISISVSAGMIWAIYLSGYYGIIQEDGLGFHPDNSSYAINDMWFVFRSDPAQFLILPLAGIICFTTQNRLGKPLGIMMLWYYSLVFLLPIFSFYTMFDYRMILLIALGSITIMLPSRNLKSYYSKVRQSLGLS